METANEQLNPSELGSILKNFSEESHKMDMMDEMMNESLNDILNESDEDEQDLIVDKILDEIGIEVSGKLSKLKTVNDRLDSDDLSIARGEKKKSDKQRT
ncbi:hypothetical protein SSS_07121 [Sarcoptes scabiei]|nr:hypothetical protein SSS_07121 [Sarcoptes scabiei]